METFPAGIYPEYEGNARDVEARILESKLGDGYSQRCADGLNTLDEIDSWVFKGSDADIDTVENFLIARGGWDAFEWQPPRQSVAKKWTCKKWRRVYDEGDQSTLTCAFTREWDL